MNINDIMIVGTHQVRLGLVLGLIEDAESPLEAYRWATTALMHAFDTKDSDLRERVSKLLAAKELSPYKPYIDVHEAGHKEKQRMAPAVMRFQLKMAIEELMGKKDGEGHPLFNQKNHWWAVYRICVDKEILNLKENRYKEFIALIDSMCLQSVNSELDMATLSNITQDLYCYPFALWDSHKPYGEGSRKMTAFLRMKKVGEEFMKILEEKGF